MNSIDLDWKETYFLGASLGESLGSGWREDEWLSEIFIFNVIL